MKVFANKERSGWILDEIHDDFVSYTKHEISSKNPDACFVINPWGLSQVKSRFPNSKVLTLQHHIDTLKLDLYDFNRLESNSDLIVVPNKFTYEELIKHVDKKKVVQLSYWVLDKRTKESSGSEELKKKLSPNGEKLIGSFQKDGEGKSNKPKMSKGPDVFVEIVDKIHQKENVKVILAGYNRRYLTSELENRGIPYEFFEKHKDLNLLYDCLDSYFVTSRIEGGPQAVLEAPIRRIPILSTDVGMASAVLDPECLCNGVDDYLQKYFQGVHVSCVEKNYQNVQRFLPKIVVGQFDELLERMA